MLGAFSVGKTSLVKRFVQSIFSEKYQTTIGVKIDKKTVSIGSNDIDMVIWDLPGDDDFQSIKQSYIKGAAGYMLVIDGTRKSTLDVAFEIRENVKKLAGDIPSVLVINKADLVVEWDFPEDILTELEGQGLTVYTTSAKTGDNVEEAFRKLAEAMVS